MPTYEYECIECQSHFEVFQNISEEPVKTCQSCGGKVRRVINGGAGIIFRGSGFYVTDKSGVKKPAGAPACEKKDSSPACKNCPAAEKSA
jgi:putative FmdB family regulatory protein